MWDISLWLIKASVTFSPIPFDAQFIRSLLTLLVHGSARLSFDDIKSIEITSFGNNCLTVLCLWQMCLDLLLYTKFYALDIAAWLSQWMHKRGTSLSHRGISSKNYRSHSASSPTLSKAINSDSIVERAMQFCLEDFQDTVASPRVKMYPLIDFDFSESIIQFASIHPSSISGYFSYLKAYSLVFLHSLLLIVGQFNDHH